MEHIREDEEKIILVCCPWLELPHLQMSVFWIPNIQFAPNPILLHVAIVMLAIASCFLPLALCGKALTWDFSCKGDDPQGFWPHPSSRRMPAPSVPICQSSRECQQRTWEGHSLERKAALPTAMGVCVHRHKLCTGPAPSANLHLTTHNQTEGCAWSYSWLVREKWISHNTVQPALQSPVAAPL